MRLKGLNRAAVRKGYIRSATANGREVAPALYRIFDEKSFLFALAVLLAAFTFLLYSPTSAFKFLKLDDDSYVTTNLAVRRGITAATIEDAFSGNVAGNWQPVTVLSHAMDCTVFGLDAGAHHLVSVGLHVVNLLLLVLLVARWAGRPWLALVSGAFFALHPLRVESVAWVAERKDVLSTMFWLAGLLVYDSWVKKPLKSKYVLLSFFLLLGLCSKAMLVTFPFTLLLLDVWPLRRIGPPSGWRDGVFWRGLAGLAREKVPLFVIAMGFCFVAVRAQQSAGAVAGLEALPVLVRIQTALVAYVGYLGKFVWPVNLACMYPHPGGWPWWMVVGSAALLIIFTGLALASARSRPWWFFGWFWYLGTLVPVIGLVQIGGQWMADRYTYVPLIGPVLALVWELDRFMSTGRARMIAGAVGITAALAACAALTSRQLMTWKDTETLSRHAIKTTGGSAAIWTNLAICHAEKGRLPEALRDFKHVAAAKPRDPDALNNVGRVLEQMGNLEEAGGYYMAVIKINPSYILARQNLGRVCTLTGRDDLAIAQFRKVILLAPDDPSGYLQLARILAVSPQPELRNGQEAVKLAARGCQLEPRASSSGREILAAAYSSAGLSKDAARELAKAADLARDAGQKEREKTLRAGLAEFTRTRR